MTETNSKLFSFIKDCPTAYHTAGCVARTLAEHGFKKLEESDSWEIKAGGRYFTTRNNSSIIAFRIPEGAAECFMISAAHSDSPAFKIKENFELNDSHFARLSTEKYGGMLISTWFDRPLSIAGRVVVRCADSIETRLVDFKEMCAIIPSVAIHMNRNANENASYNPATDAVPLAGYINEFDLKARAASLAGTDAENILASDLFLYNPEEGVEWNGMICAPRLDDLQCAFATLEAFISAEQVKAVDVMCVFDNEEVGSATKQGAESTFLEDVISRICSSLGKTDEERYKMIASSMMLSCDNAHSVHPNHPELSDRANQVFANGGVVIKYNANQKYTTDAISAAIFSLICDKAGVPYQRYANRADMPGGSTLGSIANTKLSVNTIDIGLAQLAMHSSYESAGAYDTDHMINAVKQFFKSSIICREDGSYTVV